MSSTIPRLPPDVIRLIIQASLDFPVLPTLQATQMRYRALRLFALVDSTWADLAQRELCREVVIEGVETQASVLGVLQREGKAQGSLVESLALGLQEGYWEPEPVVSWAPVLVTVTGLRALSLYHVSAVEQLGRYVPPSTVVHTICLRSCTFGPSPDGVPLLNLRRLALSRISRQYLDAILSAPFSFAPNLTELMMLDMNSSTFSSSQTPRPPRSTATTPSPNSLASHLTTLLLGDLPRRDHPSLLFPTPNRLQHLIITHAQGLAHTTGHHLPALRTLSFLLPSFRLGLLRSEEPQVWNSAAVTPSLEHVRLGRTGGTVVNSREEQARRQFESAVRMARPEVEFQQLECGMPALQTPASLFPELDTVRGLLPTASGKLESV